MLLLGPDFGEGLRVGQCFEHAGDGEGGSETDLCRVLGAVGESRCEGVLRVLGDVGVDVG